MFRRYGMKIENLGVRIENGFVQAPEKFYINPESISILQPVENDIGYSDYRLAVFRDNQWWGDSRDIENYPNENDRIIERAGKPFFWPKSEEIN